MNKHEEQQSHCTVADTPDKIRLFQLISAKHAVLLESKGMRHSSLSGGIKGAWAKHYGMSPRAKHLDIVARIQEEINLIAARIHPSPQQELPLNGQIRQG